MTILKNKFALLGLCVAAILSIPLIAMQISDQVNWEFPDFIVAALLLFGLGSLCLIIMQRVSKKAIRIALIITVIMAFVLLWAELAVGIFGSPFAGS